MSLLDMLEQLGVDGVGDDEDQIEDERVKQHPVYAMDVKVNTTLATSPDPA